VHQGNMQQKFHSIKIKTIIPYFQWHSWNHLIVQSNILVGHFTAISIFADLTSPPHWRACPISVPHKFTYQIPTFWSQRISCNHPTTALIKGIWESNDIRWKMASHRSILRLHFYVCLSNQNTCKQSTLNSCWMSRVHWK
jgi:hypothetical protein